MKFRFLIFMLTAQYFGSLACAGDWDSLRCENKAGLSRRMGGDQPSHVAVDTCGPAARTVIDRLNLPNNEIHCCTEKKVSLGRESVAVVWVRYGPGEDCVSGCGYNEWIGLWDGTDPHALPDPRRELLVPQAVHQGVVAGRAGAEVLNLNPRRANVNLSRRDGRFGWDVHLQKFDVQEIGFASGKTIYDFSGNYLNVATRLEETWSGTVFAYFEGTLFRVDPSHMTRSVREATIFQECRYQKNPPPGQTSYSCKDYEEGDPPFDKYNPRNNMRR